MNYADTTLPGPAACGEDTVSGLAVQFACGHLTRLALPFDRIALQGMLQRMVQTVFAAADAPFVQLELLVADEAYMEDLNRQSMDCAGPTNVLSFPASAPVVPATGGACAPSLPLAAGHACRTEPLFLGSLVLAPHTLLREAHLYGQEPEYYCIRLLAHGFSHLLGLDHGPEMDAVAGQIEGALRLR